MGLLWWLRDKRSAGSVAAAKRGRKTMLRAQPLKYLFGGGEEALGLAFIFAEIFATILIFQKMRRWRTNADGPPRELVRTAKAAGQEHIFNEWAQLNQGKRAQLISMCEVLDFKAIKKAFEASYVSATIDQSNEIVPIPADFVHPLDVDPLTGYTDEYGPTRQPLLRHGLPLVAVGKVAVLCLAGGQGTRLGSDAPKGMFDIGLPSHKSLFQIHCDRLWRIQAMAAFWCHRDKDDVRSPIQLVIMTSPATDQPTRHFFQEHNYFRLHQQNVHFIIQDQLPCLTPDGKIIKSTRSTLAMAPNGNGGMYTALVKSGILDLLEQRGVQYIDTFCVDNALARVADPHFVGLTDMEKADVGCKVMAKAYPEERVGVFALRGDKLEVVEYSELDPRQATAINPASSQLLYNWANISTFCFTTSFIRVAAQELETTGCYHIARKQIPSVDGPVQGIKLESFIFDPLQKAQKVCLMEVERAGHFAPVKNANGASHDTPDTAREATLALHRRWLERAGGILRLPGGESGPEISSSRCYFGENLAKIADGRIFISPYDENLQDTLDEAEVESRLRQEEERHERDSAATSPPTSKPFETSCEATSHLLSSM